MQYAFQDLLSLTVESNGMTRYDEYFDNEYRRINETRSVDVDPTWAVTLQIVSDLPDDLPADAIVRNVRFKKLFDFSYAIAGLGTPNATVWFKDHPVSRLYTTAVGVFIQAQVLEPVMYLSYLEQGCLFMHSAGVANDGNAYVFPAHGGTGKTTTSISLMNHGYDFLGDDLLIVDPSKQTVYPYPRPLHIFTYNVRNLQGATLPLGAKAAVYFKNVLRYGLENVLRTEFLISTRIHASDIFPGLRFGTASTLHRIVFLIKDGPTRVIDVTDPAAAEEHARAIIESADLNESLYGILDDPARSDEIKAKEIDVALRLLETAGGFSYLNTHAMDLDDIPAHLAAL